MSKLKRATRLICFECGKQKECVKSWIGDSRWVYMCWDCLEEDEDGYAVCLS